MEIRRQHALTRCRHLVSQPDCRAAYLQDVQSKTQGISGYFSNYIPEEVIAAAGFHPLRIIGRYETSNHHGRSLYTPVCSFVRDIFAAAESDGLSLVDNMVFPNSCDSLKLLQQTWKSDLAWPPIYVLLHPVQADEHSVHYFAQQIEKLAGTLKKRSGLNFTDSQLAEVVQRYSHTRQLLRKIYASADGAPPLLKGSERIALVTAGLIMDRDEYNQLLEQIVAEAPSVGSIECRIGKKIMVIGPLVDNLELLETIEEFGASIVADDVTNGSRYFDVDVDPNGNLYENLARRYLRAGPSPTLNSDIRDDERVFRRRVTDLHPDGVIFINQKFCEPHVHNYLAKRDVLRQMKVSALMLEVEHDRAVVSERDLLRIESFIAMLGEN